ncbi:hypothetical protein CALCODRAFT_487735, partial [Calocera cornea HHB12733]
MPPQVHVVCNCELCGGKVVAKATRARHSKQAEQAALLRLVSKPKRTISKETHRTAQRFLKKLAQAPQAPPAPQRPPPGGLELEQAADFDIDMDEGDAMPRRGIDIAS